MSENTRKRAVPQKEKESNAAHKRAVIAATSSMTAEAAVKKVTEAGLTINKTLADVNSQVVQLVDEMRRLDEAIRIKQEELESVHGREQALREIDQLQADFELRKAELNTEMERLQRDITETRAKAASEMAAEREAAEVAHQRAEEEYQYKSNQSRRQQEDAWLETMRRRNREADDLRDAREREWTAREEALKAREQELETLRKQVSEFPAILAKEKDTAGAIVGNKVKSEWETRVALLQKDMETNGKISASTIESLRAENSRLLTTIERLNGELTEAKKQVQSIAERALESASGARALSEVQSVISNRDQQGRGK